MKRLSITALAVAAVGFSGAALADAEIFSPKADEFVYNNAFRVFASEDTALYTDTTRTLRVRIRNIGCDADTQSSGDNVRSLNAAFPGGTFDYTFDLTGLASGEYCLVYNSLWDSAGQADGDGDRVLTPFTIVDTYAKIGGTIGMGADGRGNSGTHAFEGEFYNIGGQTFGSVAINYRTLGTTCTFDSGVLTVFAFAPGDGARIDSLNGSCANSDVTTVASLFLMDRDLETTVVEYPYAPRGSLIFRWSGSVNNVNAAYDVDGSPGQSAPTSWVPLERGNVIWGSRY